MELTCSTDPKGLIPEVLIRHSRIIEPKGLIRPDRIIEPNDIIYSFIGIDRVNRPNRATGPTEII